MVTTYAISFCLIISTLWYVESFVNGFQGGRGAGTHVHVMRDASSLAKTSTCKVFGPADKTADGGGRLEGNVDSCLFNFAGAHDVGDQHVPLVSLFPLLFSYGGLL